MMVCILLCRSISEGVTVITKTLACKMFKTCRKWGFSSKELLLSKMERFFWYFLFVFAILYYCFHLMNSLNLFLLPGYLLQEASENCLIAKEHKTKMLSRITERSHNLLSILDRSVLVTVSQTWAVCARVNDKVQLSNWIRLRTAFLSEKRHVINNT